MEAWGAGEASGLEDRRCFEGSSRIRWAGAGWRSPGAARDLADEHRNVSRPAGGTVPSARQLFRNW